MTNEQATPEETKAAVGPSELNVGLDVETIKEAAISILEIARRHNQHDIEWNCVEGWAAAICRPNKWGPYADV